MTYGAYCFVQNQRLQVGPLKTFLFIRPVSTKAIANARLVVVWRSVVISMIPLTLACVVAVLLAARSTVPTGLPEFVGEHMDLGGVGIALLLFCGIFAIIWCVQWTGNAMALLAVLGITSLFLLVVFGDDFSRLEETYVLGSTAIVVFGAVAFVGYLAHQRDLIEKKSLYFSLAAWPILAAGLSMFLHWEQSIHGGGSPYELLLHNTGNVLALAVLTVAPLASVPLLMHYSRHR